MERESIFLTLSEKENPPQPFFSVVLPSGSWTILEFHSVTDTAGAIYRHLFKTEDQNLEVHTLKH